MTAAKRKPVRLADTGPDIREMIADWSIYIGQLAPSTQKLYRREAERLATWLEAEGHDTGVAGIGHKTLTEFMNALQAGGAAESSRGITYRSIQQFFKWLVEIEEEIPAPSPMAKVPAPSQKAKPVDVMDTEALRTLLDTVRRDNSFEGRRDHALLRLLIDLGLRIGELAGMTVEGVNREMYRVTVTGKTGTRTLSVERKTMEALTRYLRVRGRHRAADRSELWLALKGSPNGVLTHWGIRQMVERRVDQAGLTGRIYPHRFRHTWAHRWMAAGHSTQDLAHNAGWTSTAMASRYGASAQAERARAAALRANLAEEI